MIQRIYENMALYPTLTRYPFIFSRLQTNVKVNGRTDLRTRFSKSKAGKRLLAFYQLLISLCAF